LGEALVAIAAFAQNSEQAVMTADDAFRVAKLNRDINALDRVLHEQFYEMNQNGNGRDKTQFLDLFRTFHIGSLTTDDYKVSVVGNTASVRGTQTEDGHERMHFLRVYVNGPAGWRLLSSLQARRP
jgi:hypothetical protein